MYYRTTHGYNAEGALFILTAVGTSDPSGTDDVSFPSNPISCKTRITRTKNNLEIQ
jgi:hypothetical protein